MSSVGGAQGTDREVVAHDVDATTGSNAAAHDPASVRSPAPRLLRRSWHHVTRVASGIRWYVHELMGDTAYAKYVARHEALHPGVEPLTERAFWRQRTDEAERAPVARCC